MCACLCAQLCRFSHVQFCVTPWTVTLQAPLSMGFSRQQYWSGLPCLPPGDLSDPGIEPTSLSSAALAGEFFTTNTTWKVLCFFFFFFPPGVWGWGLWYCQLILFVQFFFFSVFLIYQEHLSKPLFIYNIILTNHNLFNQFPIFDF